MKYFEDIEETVVQNGLITGTMLGVEDHGIMTFLLYIEDEYGTCGYGGWSLDSYDKDKEERVGTARGMQAIMEILECLEVDRWEKLKGTYVRCLVPKNQSKILSIGHITKNKWVNLDNIFKG